MCSIDSWLTNFVFSPYQFWVDQAQFLGSVSSARVRSFALCNFGHKVKEKKYIQPNTLYKQPSVLCCREPKEYRHWCLDFIEQKQPTESWSDTYYHCFLGNLHFSGRSEMKRGCFTTAELFWQLGMLVLHQYPMISAAVSVLRWYRACKWPQSAALLTQSSLFKIPQ